MTFIKQRHRLKRNCQHYVTNFRKPIRQLARVMVVFGRSRALEEIAEAREAEGAGSRETAPDAVFYLYDILNRVTSFAIFFRIGSPLQPGQYCVPWMAEQRN